MTYKSYVEFDLTIADHPLQEFAEFPNVFQTRALWDHCVATPDLQVGDIILEEVGSEKRWLLDCTDSKGHLKWFIIGSKI